MNTNLGQDSIFDVVVVGSGAGGMTAALRAFDRDASVLVIEHDMPLIMGISDRVYCLELGSIIAEGAPDAVRHDPAVVASYLGTDQRAIARSGARAGSDPVG